MEELKKHISAQERSGKSISEYCRQHGIATKRFYYWRKRLEREDSFIEVGGARGGSFELKIREGLSVMVPPKFDAEHLRQLLQVLGC